MVITGVSGSGKSSLAFDTIYAEGQRRYMVESLSAYGIMLRSGLRQDILAVKAQRLIRQEWSEILLVTL